VGVVKSNSGKAFFELESKLLSSRELVYKTFSFNTNYTNPHKTNTNLNREQSNRIFNIKYWNKALIKGLLLTNLANQTTSLHSYMNDRKLPDRVTVNLKTPIN